MRCINVEVLALVYNTKSGCLTRPSGRQATGQAPIATIRLIRGRCVSKSFNVNERFAVRRNKLHSRTPELHRRPATEGGPRLRETAWCCGRVLAGIRGKDTVARTRSRLLYRCHQRGVVPVDAALGSGQARWHVICFGERQRGVWARAADTYTMGGLAMFVGGRET